MTRFRLLTVALALLMSPSAWADLKTYDIDPQYQQEIFAALTDILTPDPARGLIMDAHGRVELLPSGQILVNASAETLEQVERVLQAIRTRSVAAAPRASLRYWALFGTSPQPANAASEPGTSVPTVLNDVLGELKRVHGELTFRVIGSAALVTQSGQHGNVDGTTLSVAQMAHIQSDTLNAEIEMALEGQAPPPMFGRVDLGDLKLRTTLKRGEFVVLGETQLLGSGLDGLVFFIVHWSEE
jgi:hypothetical protein